MAKYTKAEREEAVNDLKHLLRDGDTVYTILNKVSASGMSRVISPLLLRVDVDRVTASGRKATDHGYTMLTLGEGELTRRYIGFLTAKALDYGNDGDQGVRIGGCGMDMGFALVDALGAMVGVKLNHKWL